MRLGGRIDAAIQVLADMAARKRPVTDALRDWGLSHRFAGAGDRAAIGSLVHDSLRKRASQAWRMDSDAPADIVIATLLTQWGMDAAQLAASLEGDRFAPAMPEAARLQAWNARDLSQAPDHVRADIPPWCAPHFAEAFGEDWVEEAAALSERPPLDLRVNTLKSDRAKMERQLSRFGAAAFPHCPTALRIKPGMGATRLPNVQAETGYQKGWFEIQDAGSQMAAMLAGAAPGEQVLDYCAGAGGKTLALAAAMNNKGQVHAHDADRNRLAPIHDRLRRAGTRNVQVHGPRDDMGALEGSMDLVVVDAPCTGSGTWRRRPDAKWRLDETNLATRISEQDEVLAQAQAYVKPGGRLVYITCSLIPQENTGRIAAFLDRHRDFSAAPADAQWLRLCDYAHCAPSGLASVLLTPRKTGTDGFHVALLQRGS